ncbi:hypothetical protein ID866_11094 [Astraeus odoratus]|nr:hypothetical protein ID866_11094 [Astraeus odoratus]
MVSEAEKYKAEDSAAARFQSKNNLESYAYDLRSSLNDESFSSKFYPADKATLQFVTDITIRWLERSQEESKEEYEEVQQGLEHVTNQIMQKLYYSTINHVGGFPRPGEIPGDGGAPGRFRPSGRPRYGGF